MDVCVDTTDLRASKEYLIVFFVRKENLDRVLVGEVKFNTAFVVHFEVPADKSMATDIKIKQ
jgi:hypothetical protein